MYKKIDEPCAFVSLMPEQLQKIGKIQEELQQKIIPLAQKTAEELEALIEKFVVTMRQIKALDAHYSLTFYNSHQVSAQFCTQLLLLKKAQLFIAETATPITDSLAEIIAILYTKIHEIKKIANVWNNPDAAPLPPSILHFIQKLNFWADLLSKQDENIHSFIDEINTRLEKFFYICNKFPSYKEIVAKNITNFPELEEYYSFFQNTEQNNTPSC